MFADDERTIAVREVDRQAAALSDAQAEGAAGPALDMARWNAGGSMAEAHGDIVLDTGERGTWRCKAAWARGTVQFRWR
jgi:hypothetical protein